jgi:hypothetical protein
MFEPAAGCVLSVARFHAVILTAAANDGILKHIVKQLRAA